MNQEQLQQPGVYRVRHHMDINDSKPIVSATTSQDKVSKVKWSAKESAQASEERIKEREQEILAEQKRIEQYDPTHIKLNQLEQVVAAQAERIEYLMSIIKKQDEIPQQ